MTLTEINKKLTVIYENYYSIGYKMEDALNKITTFLTNTKLIKK